MELGALGVLGNVDVNSDLCEVVWDYRCVDWKNAMSKRAAIGGMGKAEINSICSNMSFGSTYLIKRRWPSNVTSRRIERDLGPRAGLGFVNVPYENRVGVSRRSRWSGDDACEVFWDSKAIGVVLECGDSSK